MEEYLSNLNYDYKTYLLNLLSNNKTINNFFHKCKNNNINLFNSSDNLKSFQNIKNEIKVIKMKCYQVHGVNIVKDYSKKKEALNLIRHNYLKLEKKIKELDKILFELEFMNDNKIFDKIKYDSNNELNIFEKKVNYSQNKPVSNFIMLNKSFIAEYSNENT